MNCFLDKIRQVLPVSVIALSLGACATAAPTQPTQQVTVDSMLRVAELTRSGGDLVNAVGLYQRAHELAPQDERPLVALGQVFTQLGSPASAAEAYRAAVAVAPSDVEARRGLGVSLIGVGQPEAAILELEKALDLAKDYRIYNSLGVAYDMTGDHASAQTYYNEGLALSPGNLEISNNLGLSLALEGRYPEAIELLEKIANDPAAPSRYRQNLALALGLAGDRDRARQLAQQDLDHATVEKNLSYFDVLKGLGDHRTMAAALGVHMVGQAAPMVAPMAPAMDGMTALPPVEVPAADPAPQGFVTEPVAPVSTLEAAPVESPVGVEDDGVGSNLQPTADAEIAPVEVAPVDATPAAPASITRLRPLPTQVAPAVLEEQSAPAASDPIDATPLPAADIDAKPLDDFERETGRNEEPRPTSPARFEEPVPSEGVEHRPQLSAVDAAAEEVVLIARETDAPSCATSEASGGMLQLASAGGAMADAALAMLGFVAAGPSNEAFAGSELSDTTGFAASRFAR